MVRHVFLVLGLQRDLHRRRDPKLGGLGKEGGETNRSTRLKRDEALVERLVQVRRQQQAVPLIQSLTVRRFFPWLDVRRNEEAGVAETRHCTAGPVQQHFVSECALADPRLDQSSLLGRRRGRIADDLFEVSLHVVASIARKVCGELRQRGAVHVMPTRVSLFEDGQFLDAWGKGAEGRRTGQCGQRT